MWLWASTLRGGAPSLGSLQSAFAATDIADLARNSFLGADLEQLRGRCAVVSVADQLTAARTLLELDGVVRRLVLCTPDLPNEYLPQIIRDSEADTFVGPASSVLANGFRIDTSIDPGSNVMFRIAGRRQSHDTEWTLLTSGTTGAPKLVLHTLASLTSAIVDTPADSETVTWSTFYDIRRYGGLQIYLRALRMGSMVLSAQDESVANFLARAGRAGVTHISGTASHWRRVLMSGSASLISPRYIRLSGEIADQGILDGLSAAFPSAEIVHAFASTEAGVAFEVTDRKTGFPESLLDNPNRGVELKVQGDTLRIRSPGNALRYLGPMMPEIRGPDGYVDTGDRLELREGRYTFVGRSGGVINVGGLKVYPEEVEATINAHPWVQMSRVRSRRNAITGAVVTAEVVLKVHRESGNLCPDQDELRRQIIDRCASELPSHKVPAIIKFVDSLELTAAGKLVRTNA